MIIAPKLLKGDQPLDSPQNICKRLLSHELVGQTIILICLSQDKGKSTPYNCDRAGSAWLRSANAADAVAFANNYFGRKIHTQRFCNHPIVHISISNRTAVMAGHAAFNRSVGDCTIALRIL